MLGWLGADASLGAELWLLLLKKNTTRNKQTEQLVAVAVIGVVMMVFDREVVFFLEALWDCRTQNPGKRCLEVIK